jgi:hypothetical protein
MVRRVFLTVVTLAGVAGISNLADADEVKPPHAMEQCGECHMIFPAKMLPARSWTALLSDLDHHFGESATMPENTRKEILEYLAANAADSPNVTPRDRHYISEIGTDAPPLRITKTRWWNQMHADFDFEGVKRTKVKSASNCLGCHPNGFE